MKGKIQEFSNELHLKKYKLCYVHLHEWIAEMYSNSEKRRKTLKSLYTMILFT